MIKVEVGAPVGYCPSSLCPLPRPVDGPVQSLSCS